MRPSQACSAQMINISSSVQRDQHILHFNGNSSEKEENRKDRIPAEEEEVDEQEGGLHASPSLHHCTGEESGSEQVQIRVSQPECLSFWSKAEPAGSSSGSHGCLIQPQQQMMSL